MFNLEDVLQLKDNEDVKLVVRRHPVTLAGGLGIAFLCIVLPFFFLFPLFSWGLAGIVFFGIVLIAGIVVAVRTILLWDADVLLISTLRLVDVDQKGIFSRFVKEVPLTSIQEVSWHRKGIIDTVFRVGTLEVAVMGATPLVVSRVAHPQQIHEFLNDLRHSTKPKRTDLDPERQERLKKLSTVLEELPDEALERIERATKTEDRSAAVASFLDDSPKDAPKGFTGKDVDSTS